MLRDCTDGAWLIKFLIPKAGQRDHLPKPWHLIVWRMFCSLCYKNVTTPLICKASTFLLETIMFVEIFYQVQFLVIHCTLIPSSPWDVQCPKDDWLDGYLSAMTQVESWKQYQTHIKWQIILHHCSCANYNWITPLINISTQTYNLFKQQGFLQMHILLCIVEPVQGVSVLDSLLPTVPINSRMEYTNHHKNLIPFPLHCNTDTWCTSTPL